MFGLFKLITLGVGLCGRSRGRSGHGLRHLFGEGSGKGHGLRHQLGEGGGKSHGRNGKGHDRARKCLQNTTEQPAICREFSFLRPALPQERPLSIDNQPLLIDNQALPAREQTFLASAQPVLPAAYGEIADCPLCENHCSLESPSCEEGEAFVAQQRQAAQRSRV